MADSRSEILAKLRQYLQDTLLIQAEALDESADLFQNGMIDSFGMIELVSFIDAAFGIKLDNDDLVSSELSSLGGMIQLVQAHQQAGR